MYSTIELTFRKADGRKFVVNAENHEEAVKTIGNMLDGTTLLESLDESEYDDMVEMVMELTEPHQNITEDDAKAIIGDAIASGWKVPKWFDPKDFLYIKADLDSAEEDE